MLTTFSGRRASQDEGELTAFCDYLRAARVKRYLEIGARECDTFHFIVNALGEGSYCVAVDLPGGLWGKSTTGEKAKAAVEDLRNTGHEVNLFLGDSRSAGIVEVCHELGPFDAILIDGDHTYEGVKADWEAYRNLAPIIAFHDIVGEGQFERVTRRGVEVPKLWAEIKASGANVVEFVSPGSAMGIGVWLAP